MFSVAGWKVNQKLKVNFHFGAFSLQCCGLLQNNLSVLGVRNMIPFALFAFWRQWFKICFGLCIGPLLHSLWGRWWLVLCGNTLQRAAKRRVGWDCPVWATQWNHSVHPLGQEGSFAFIFYPDSKQGLQSVIILKDENSAPWCLPTLFSRYAVVPNYNPCYKIQVLCISTRKQNTSCSSVNEDLLCTVMCKLFPLLVFC